MRRNQKPYSVFQLASAVSMILALLWLTISLPFVNASQQGAAKQHKTANNLASFGGNEEEAANLSGNTTEEKNPCNNSFSEEYLHHHHEDTYIVSIVLRYHKCENAGIYIAFHGELDAPPPDVA